jgi:tetratricopeptide (TPR) repeat protein
MACGVNPYGNRPIEIDPGHADSHFQLATSLERQGDHLGAKRHFERALDLDALRFRADTKINDRIRAVSKDYPLSISQLC